MLPGCAITLAACSYLSARPSKPIVRQTLKHQLALLFFTHFDLDQSIQHTLDYKCLDKAVIEPSAYSFASTPVC